jgi:ribosomal protein S18 acetylase RimI-like enzyme
MSGLSERPEKVATSRVKTRDIYKHIYGGCQDTTLWRALLATTKLALNYAEEKDTPDHSFVCDDEGWNGGLQKIKQHGFHFGLLHDVQRLAELLTEDYAAQLGPRLSVEGPQNCSMEEPHILTFDFDQDNELCQFGLPPYRDWHNTGLAHAATAYRRCCGWDFAPGEAGIWSCYYVITDGMGSGEGSWHYNGNVVGFTILYDRDKDGQYESLGHIWTAAAARRKGIGRALIAHARQHFPIKKIEGPLTDDSRGLFEAVWPEALKS